MKEQFLQRITLISIICLLIEALFGIPTTLENIIQILLISGCVTWVLDARS